MHGIWRATNAMLYETVTLGQWFGTRTDSQQLHLADHTIQSILNGLKSKNSTLLALNVLAKRTQRIEPGAACVEGAEIHLLLMTGTSQMLVQRVQRAERIMAKVAFVGVSVPALRARKVFGLVVRAVGPGEEAGWVSDDIILVILTDVTVDGVSVDSGGALTVLEVEDES
ncbi:hypothetical protein V5O48_005517 [Marasmius crinis-equi]|uniref:Uncharacterized protein n=1 Tax=Marasmius crinis-equi TaxID=585013 RepID=A0ABR3FM25_9AGAR